MHGSMPTSTRKRTDEGICPYEIVERKCKMKKLILTNAIVVITFILFDPLLNYLGELADTYSLGAEMVLGMFTPLLFGFFILLALGLIIFSINKSISGKDIKQLIPISIFAIGIIGYILVSDSNSFWIRLVTYYINL